VVPSSCNAKEHSVRASEGAELIGKQGLVDSHERHLPGVRVLVCVLDARAAYGRIDLQVEPIGGDGTAWIDSRRITFARSSGRGGRA
jgi:hypothetical protein